ncbi:MAG: SDR family oxidoreductase [Flavisolibacter sp.]
MELVIFSTGITLNRKIDKMNKKVIITGASGGFGKLTTLQLLAKGHQVAATMRGVSGKNKSIAEELEKAGAIVVEIDVTNDNSVTNGVEKAINKLGGLDVLINNAGVGVLGIQELFTTDDLKALFDINVFGVHRMMRAVLPYLREQGKGLIVNISSLLGRITVPFYGPYNATKWAVEALSENSRSELSQFGIETCIVEPGGYPTTFMTNLMTPSDDSRNEGYGNFVNAPKASFEGFEAALKNNPAQDPENVAKAVAALLDMPHGKRPFRTVVDKMGMGDPINEYNDHLAKVTEGIYQAFGTSELLKVKV